ncbi:MAG: TetR/AcrR family transcriptional regulator [Lachnospiraceae bacterium]|nr:TetR/AcrR family transcriptional regulator [Lachnospiraceae bacterium]
MADLPKAYSDQEKEYIRKRLKEEAAKCLAQYGIKRTTVDEIVQRVKIPKGTFYLFYQSKEMLLFEVILEQHDLIEEKLWKEISTIAPKDFNAEKLTDIIVGFYQMAGEMPILKLLNSGEIELLARKLPPQVLEEHLGHDNAMVDRLFASFPIKNNVDTRALSAAFRAIYFSTLHKEEIGEEHYEEGLRLMVVGLINQLL